MGARMHRRLPLVAALAAIVAAALTPAAPATTTRSCGSVANPYPGTRYEGVSLSRITATGVSCATARRVARGAHRKALGLTPSASGLRRFSWNGWRIAGDLRPSSDRYVATRGAARVRWRF
jgi:hypothetical protein